MYILHCCQQKTFGHKWHSEKLSSHHQYQWGTETSVQWREDTLCGQPHCFNCPPYSQVCHTRSLLNWFWTCHANLHWKSAAWMQPGTGHVVNMCLLEKHYNELTSWRNTWRIMASTPLMNEEKSKQNTLFRVTIKGLESVHKIWSFFIVTNILGVIWRTDWANGGRSVWANQPSSVSCWTRGAGHCTTACLHQEAVQRSRGRRVDGNVEESAAVLSCIGNSL